MPGPSECWVCGRTAEDISALFKIEVPEDTELTKQASQINWFRTKFMESAANWRKSIPKEFREMDFLFVISNPDQFKTVKVIGEVDDSRKHMMDWLVKASFMLRKGEEGQLQNLNLSSLDAPSRQSIVRAIEQFEATWHRRLAREEGQAASSAGAAGFQGLNLGDGLEYLIAGGLLYYDIQAMLIQFARNAAISKLPQWHVQVLTIRGFAPVAVCDVCSLLIQGLRVGREAPMEPAHEAAPVEAKPSHGPEAPVPAVPQVAPKRSKAQAAAEEIPAGASDEFVKLIEKFGPADDADAPKTHYLHEHRLKEDWDEIAEKSAEQE